MLHGRFYELFGASRPFALSAALSCWRYVHPEVHSWCCLQAPSPSQCQQKLGLAWRQTRIRRASWERPLLQICMPATAMPFCPVARYAFLNKYTPESWNTPSTPPCTPVLLTLAAQEFGSFICTQWGLKRLLPLGVCNVLETPARRNPSQHASVVVILCIVLLHQIVRSGNAGCCG